jgi:retron-type reverse transcriptase
MGGGRIRGIFMKTQLTHNFEKIISIENLLLAWREFEKGKRNRNDVQKFSLNIMNNLFSLHSDLLNHTYKHSGYQAFKINDTRPRDIHKAEVRDRLLHHAIHQIFYPFFDKTFINDSYSCRLNKGTHKAVNRLEYYLGKASNNNTRTCYVLKCDIRKFFASIDHKILLNILAEYIPDKDILWLLKEIIISFNTKPNTGLPLGNLTSQLFVNIYMNKFDQFMKHKLKTKYYIRYADDFAIID